jgi:hypothetical protein
MMVAEADWNSGRATPFLHSALPAKETLNQ